VNAKAAFTLLELTIVVLFVGVLTVLTLSVTQVARVRSDATRCLSNLRHLATANLAYAADHESRYVPAQDQTNTIRWHGVRHATWGRFDPTKGPLAPYLGRNRQVKLCPALGRGLTGWDACEVGTGGEG
jgi:type II secretory pathway pseudopilin PulG